MPNREMSLGTIFTGRLDQSFRRAVGQVRSIVTELGNLQSKLANKARGGGLAQSLGKDNTALNKHRAAIKKTSSDYTNFTKQIAKVQGGFNRIAAAAKVTASYGIAATAIYTVISALRAGISEIIDFDQALKNLQAISGATDAQIAAMRDTIEEIARTTKFSTVEVAEGMVLLTQAGLSAEEAMNAMQATADLATGTLSSMQLTTDLMTTTLRAFGLDAIEAGRVADVMANAINKSKLTIDKLRISFNFVAAAAAQTGLSIEQTAASMMVLANNGMRASTIGTGLRQVLARLMAPTSKLRDAFKSYGIDVKDVNPRLVGYETALKNLIPTIWDHTKGTVDMGKAYSLFGLRGAQAAAVLVKSFMAGDFQTALKRVYEVGTAEDMAAKQAEGLGVKLKNLVDRAKLVALAFGEAGVAGALGAIIDLMRAVADAAASLAKTVGGQLVIQFTAWTMAIYGTIKAISILIPLISGTGLYLSLHNLITVFGILTRQMGASAATFSIFSTLIKAHPFLAIAAAVGAVVTTINYFSGATERAIEKSEQLIVENNRIISSLEVYEGALKNLNERMEKAQEENKDTTVIALEYSSVIKRLLKDHPELADKIDLTTASYKELAAAIKEVTNARVRDNIEQEIEKLKDFTKQYESQIKGFEAWQNARKELTYVIGLTEEQKHSRAKFMEGEFQRQKKEVEEIATKIEATIQSTILDLRRMAKSGMPMDDVLSMFDKLPDKIKDRLKSFSSEIKKTGLDITETFKVVETMTPSIQKFFDSLAPFDKIDFLSKFKSFQSGINSFKDSMEKMGKGKSPEIDVAVKIKEEEFLEDFQESLARKQEDAQKHIEDALRKITDLKEKGEDLDVKALEIAGQKIAAIKLEIEHLKQRKQVLEAQTETGERLVEVKELSNKIAQAEKDLQDENKKILTKALKDRLAITNKYSDEYTMIMEAMHENEIISLQEMENYYDKKAKYDVKVAREAYDRKLISADEYLSKLKILMDRGGITEVEFEDREAETKGPLDRFLHSLKKAREEGKTFGDVFQKIGSEIEDRFATGITNAMWEFIDGTKSAKEAFIAFGRSTLEWLTKLILKQTILNALQAGGGKSEGSSILSGVLSVAGSIAGAFGGGGGTAAAPGTFGGGINPDNFRIIDPVFHAKGNAFVNGVIDRATLFPMARGAGVMGEAGPEAVMPLTRLPGGNLGVKSEGGGEEKQGSPIINIFANDAQSFIEMAHRNPSAIIGPVIEGLQQGGQLRDTIRSVI